jgi:hypothetical protein
MRKLKDVSGRTFTITADQKPINRSNVSKISKTIRKLEECDPSELKQKVEIKEKPVGLRRKFERN